MITNTGKNIIAKYLIGDAPAYASYLALGCGQKPRPNITTKENVSTGTITGTILSTATITPITGLSSTVGLVVGMQLTKTSGAGAFGGVTTITSIDSLSQITVTSTTANTTGSITFNTRGVAQLLSVSSVSGLWVGARIRIIDGVGELSTISDTIITAISSENNFTVTPSPTTDLLNTDIGISIDPAIQSLDFEMFRVPIVSRGYVNDEGTNKIILTAQLPTESRYEISEIGIYSAGANPTAGRYDSKVISAFAAEESWKLSVGTTLNSPSAGSSIFPEVETSLINALNFITNPTPAIKTSTSNGIFINATRSARYERPRFLANVLMLRGNTSYLYENNGNLDIYGTPAFLQITGQTVDLTENSSSDLLKVALSIVSIDGNSSSVPDSARIIVEFSNVDGTRYARLQERIDNASYRFASNRYVIVSKRLDELFYTSDQFSWSEVSIIKVYVATTDNLLVVNKELASNVATLQTASSHNLSEGDYVKISGVDEDLDGTYEVTGTPSSDTFTYDKIADNISDQAVVPNGTAEVPNENYYIALDAIRLDNISSINPLYGLTGYSIVQNQQETTIVKSPNTNNYIEYRFILDVV